MKRYHTGLDILKRFQKRGQATGTFGCPFFMNLSLTSKRDIFGVEEKENELLFKFNIQKEFCNLHGTLHGGAISTLVDITTGMCITSNDEQRRNSVSLQMSTTFLNPGYVNTEIYIHTRTDKKGYKIATSTCEFYNSDMDLLAKGDHVKVFVKEQV